MGEEGLNLERGSGGGGGGVVMDTPERKQITSPISKFEDSPVFNYLNSLSPIKPVKSMHITHTFNSLSFASLPSVFTSPHVSSLKESRFLRRHQFSDPSKPEFSSENGNKVGRNEEVINIAHKSAEQQQNFDPGSSSGEASAEPPYESSLAIELSRTLSYECASPDCDPTTQCGMETRGVPELNGSSTALVPYVQVDSEKGSYGSEVHIGGMAQIDENKDAAGCDWENMFADGTDLLMFDSPNDSKCLTDPSQKLLEPGTSFCTSLTDVQNAGVIEAVGLSREHEADNTSSQYENGSHIKEIAEDQDILVSLCNSEAGDTSEKVDDELASNLQRGMRRRCLVFEMVGSRRKQFDDGSSCGPSMLSQSHDNIASNDKHLIPFKPGNDTPRRVLPGIGLHLNALAATSADNKVVKHEALVTGGQPISVSRSAAYFNSSNSQEISNNSLVVSSSEREMVPAEGGAPIVEDAAQTSGYAVNEVFNHSSPKKKRRRLENAGDSETACKRCNCKKSKCLKLYCECFAAGVYCVEPCSCQECFNKPIHEDTVLATRKQIESRNPLAFAPKVIRSSDSIIEIGEESSKTPASARHKRGCNCKKSGCLKKYCECYQGGVGCSINCRCEGCKNAFGRKDGSTSIGPEELEEEEEVEECERSVADKSSLIITTPNDAEQNTNFAIPATPLQFGRQSIQLPVSSQSKRPPRSSFLAIGSSSGLYGSQRFGKLNPLPPQGKFEKHFQTARDDEMPEILQRSGSPISSVKSASPNSKRVSPPHSNIGLSPGQRSSRKLILQSIPSFPSLTPKH